MTAADSAERAQQHYDPREVQDKWLARWDGMDLFRASDDPDDDRPRTYLLDMFPYPSGDLHMGHAEAYAIADAIARYYFHRGYNVLHPIGWDAFGLPAENAAIRNNTHPADWTYANIETQAASFRRYAVSFDWSRRLATCDPEYYRWNQWLFLRFYERGLAYRKDGYVNWCPVDQTVLANEQVDRRQVRALRRRGDPAAADPVVLQDHRVRRPAAGGHGAAGGQLARPGAADAAELDRPLGGRRDPVPDRGPGRAGDGVHHPPDTLYGATFFVIAADSPLAEEVCAPEQRAALAELPRPQVRKLTDIERQSADRPKTGVFLGGTRSTRSTASASRSGRPTTSWPTTGPARSWPCPPTTSATWTSPGRSGCRSGWWWTPADEPTRR